MSSDVSRMLSDIRDGRATAGELFPLVYGELHRMADALIRKERPDHSLQATALVNEAYLKLAHHVGNDLKDRAHFCAVAAQAMRRILVDHARQRNREKRCGKHDRSPLDSALLVSYETTVGGDLEALDDALQRLEGINARAAQVVVMRFFGGLSVEEAAAALETSISSVEREWRYARAWLHETLADQPQPSASGDSRVDGA